jgi:hypothetical protein
MTTDDPSGTVPEQSPSEADSWRQGDKFLLDAVAVMSGSGQAEQLPTPNGVALVSQSCDVVLSHRLNVQVAPIVELTGENSRAARDGKRSQYAHLPHLGDDSFIDLDQVSTVSKAALAGRRYGPGLQGDDAIRRFSAAVARRFGRFAFPDRVSDAMKVLRDLVQSKASKPASPFGQVLEEVLELRAESRDWTTAAPEVTLIFVVLPGSVPMVADDQPGAIPPSVAAYEPDSASAKSKLSEIAVALTSGTTWNALEKYWLWQLLADAAALMCEAQAEKVSGESDHPSFIGEVVSADEFPLTRVRRSEIVDLDHLSAPFPTDFTAGA